MYIAEIRSVGTSELAAKVTAKTTKGLWRYTKTEPIIQKGSLEEIFTEVKDFIESGYSVVIYHTDFMPEVSVGGDE